MKKRNTNIMRTRVGILSVCLLLLAYSVVYAQPPKIQIEQVRNGQVIGGTVQWVTGNVGAQNSHFVEGHSIPYRAVMENMPAGLLELEIGFDIKDNSKHAIDFLTCYFNLDYPYAHQDVFGHPPETIPCCDGYGPFSDSSWYPTPTPNTDPPAATWADYNAANLARFCCWGGTIQDAYYTVFGDTGAAHSEARVKIEIMVTDPTVILAWGGRIASQATWGVGNSAVNINGSPYHMRTINWSLGNIGNQDLSLNAGAVPELPVCDFTGPAEMCADETAIFTLDAPDPTYTYLWYLENNNVGATIPGSTAGSSVNVYGGYDPVDQDPNGGGTFELWIDVIKPFQNHFVTSHCSEPVTVNPVPYFELTDPGPLCPNETVTFTGPTGNYTYYWSIIDGSATISGSGQSVDVTSGTVCISGFYELQLRVVDNVTYCEYTNSVIVYYGDDTPPTISCPSAATVQCIDEVPQADISGVTASDNCDDDVTVTWEGDVSDNNSCPEIITRTYMAEDDCGNTATCTQTITIDDTIDPTITCPDGVTVECITEVPAPNTALVTASDNCGTPVVTWEGDVSDNNSCPEIITRTYMATDSCGNTATCTQTITVDDITDPSITCPAGVTVECITEVPAPNTSLVTASDNCGIPVVTWVSDVSDNNSCPEIITRTYMATDSCGNTATCTQTITVDDNTDPTITCPGGITVECITEVPAPNTSLVTASDNCGTPVVTWVSDVSDNNSCPELITRTYMATDSCGNTATCTQTITVDDNTDPNITCPGGITVECITEVPAPNTSLVTASDNCGTPEITWEGDVSDNNSCPEVITRTYMATDSCGNTATCTQTITVDDITDPTIICPGGITVECITEVPAPNTSLVTASDNCGTPVVTWVSDVSDNNSCPELITRTYMATDSCGNTATCTQTITVDDNTDPNITCPGGISVECITEVPAPNTSLVTASDNCGTPVVTWVSDVSDNNSCPEIITRTYMATDSCGNTATCTQTITVDDITDPTFDSQPTAIADIDCDAPLPTQETLTASDNCGSAAVTPSIDPFTVDYCNGYRVTHRWIATDRCGNTSEVTTSFNVLPMPPPDITAPPTYNVYCGESSHPDFAGYATSSTTCSGSDPAVTWEDFPQGTDANSSTILRVWTAENECGVSSTDNQNVIIWDQIFCSIEPPAEPPFCNMIGNTLSADPAIVLPGATYLWSIPGGSDWSIHPGTETSSTVVYNAGTGTETFTLEYTDPNGCVSTCTMDITCVGSDVFCTFTQGFYGNEGGIYFCTGQGTLQIVDSLMAMGDLVMGDPLGDGSITFLTTEGSCIILRLPGGGPSKALDDHYTDCYSWGNPIVQNNTGRFKNSLLAQTLTLELNMRLSPALGGIIMTTPVLTVAEADGCGPTGNPVSPPWSYTVPQSVYDDLEDYYNIPPTIADLKDLANDALAGENYFSSSLNDIQYAVNIINEAYDECRWGTFNYQAPPPLQSAEAPGPIGVGPQQEEDHIQVTVRPNPFHSTTNIEFTATEDDRATLEIYNLSGVKIATLYEGQVSGGQKYSIEYKESGSLRQQTYIYVLRTSKRIEHGWLIMLR